MPFSPPPLLAIRNIIARDRAQWSTDDFHFSEGFKLELYPLDSQTSFFVLMLCTGGEFRLQVDGQDYVITRHSLLVLRPAQVTHLVGVTNYTCLNLLFTQDFLRQASGQFQPLTSFRFFNRNVAAHFQLSASQAADVARQLLTIREKAQRPTHPYTPQVVRSLLLALLYDTQALCEQHNALLKLPPSRDAQLAEAFYQLLSAHFRVQHSVGFYADKLFVTAKHLSASLKATSGKTAHEWIEEAVLLYAKTLLQDPALSIAQVAEAVHYSDHAAFHKFFKKHTGHSASEFRAARPVST